MRGRIVSINTGSGTGMLQADAGGQWRFRAGGWTGRGVPSVGQPVDFRVAGGEAVEVTPVAASQVWNNVSGSFQGVIDPFGASNTGRQSFWAFYFSPSGRVSLGQYWFNYLIPFGVFTLALIGAVIFGLFYVFHHQVSVQLWLAVGALVVFKFSVLAWISFVMHLKRMHDLNMSWGAGYVVDNFIPLGRDWMAFRMMCQQGTPGPNSFGDDPRRS